MNQAADLLSEQIGGFCMVLRADEGIHGARAHERNGKRIDQHLARHPYLAAVESRDAERDAQGVGGVATNGVVGDEKTSAAAFVFSEHLFHGGNFGVASEEEEISKWIGEGKILLFIFLTFKYFGFVDY